MCQPRVNAASPGRQEKKMCQPRVNAVSPGSQKEKTTEYEKDNHNRNPHRSYPLRLQPLGGQRPRRPRLRRSRRQQDHSRHQGHAPLLGYRHPGFHLPLRRYLHREGRGGEFRRGRQLLQVPHHPGRDWWHRDRHRPLQPLQRLSRGTDRLPELRWAYRGRLPQQVPGRLGLSGFCGPHRSRGPAQVSTKGWTSRPEPPVFGPPHRNHQRQRPHCRERELLRQD